MSEFGKGYPFDLLPACFRWGLEDGMHQFRCFRALHADLCYINRDHVQSFEFISAYGISMNDSA